MAVEFKTVKYLRQIFKISEEPTDTKKVRCPDRQLGDIDDFGYNIIEEQAKRF